MQYGIVNKTGLTAIWEASLKTGMSQIQLWILIRKGIVLTIDMDNEIYIHYNSLKNWLSQNNRLVAQLQLQTDLRNNPKVFTKYLRRSNRVRNNEK